MNDTASPTDIIKSTTDASTASVTARTKPGLLGVLIALIGLLAIAAGIVGVAAVAWPLVFLVPAGALAFLFSWPGQCLVPPNEAPVLALFGRYTGTVATPGWHLVNPFTPTSYTRIRRRRLCPCSRFPARPSGW